MESSLNLKTNPSYNASFFDSMYSRSKDPWGYATSEYEREKYEVSLKVLPTNITFKNALEIGCSIGVFTNQLAQRCTRLLALDMSNVALNIARERCQNHSHVQFTNLTLPKEYPDSNGPFDLIVFSEVGYYLSQKDLFTLEKHFLKSLTSEGYLLFVHWILVDKDHPLTGDQVHDSFIKLTLDPTNCIKHVVHKRETQYRLDLFQKVEPVSI